MPGPRDYDQRSQNQQEIINKSRQREQYIEEEPIQAR